MKAFAITGLKETGFVEKDERPVGAGEVRIRVDYVGFCGSDLNTYRGLNPLVKLPRVPGYTTDEFGWIADDSLLLGFDAVALNTSKPQRVANNAAYGAHRSPEAFWDEISEIL